MAFVGRSTNFFKKYFLCGCLATFVFIAVFAFERKSNLLLPTYSDVNEAITGLEGLITNSTIWQNQSIYVSKELTTHVLTNRTVTLVPKKFCKTGKSLVIMVSSAVGNFERRQTIRDTWGSQRNVSNFYVDVYFMVGRTFNKALQKRVEEEYEKHDDVIQTDIVDTYRNLTAKSLTMLKMVETHCNNRTAYFMKTDDDMYVNVPPLRNALTRRNQTDLLLGHKYFNPVPKRDPNNKWYVPKSVYSARYYPDFLSGSGYVMSTDVVRKLYRAASRIPLYFLEDVYITGMLARFAGVTPQNLPGFHPNKQGTNPCLYKSIITAHNYTRKEMVELYEGIKTNKC